MRKAMGIVAMALGLIMLSISVIVYLVDAEDERKAEVYADELISSLWEKLPPKPTGQGSAESVETSHNEVVYTKSPESDANIPAAVEIPEMPVIEVDGEQLIGVIELPTLGLKLPVISEWSYPALKKAPCRYSGSVYDNTMVILAHRYKRHFAALTDIAVGDPVFFTDAEANVYKYTVERLEILAPTEKEEMLSSEYDLTLFTCTKGGEERTTVRLKREEDF